MAKLVALVGADDQLVILSLRNVCHVDWKLKLELVDIPLRDAFVFADIYAIG